MTTTPSLFDLELVAHDLAELIERQVGARAAEPMLEAWRRCAYTDTAEPTVTQARRQIVAAWRKAMRYRALPPAAHALLER